MTHEELNAKIGFLFDGETVASLTMYFVLKKEVEAATAVKKVGIADAARDSLFEQFKGSIDEKLHSNQDLFIADISKVDEKTNATYYYDLDEKVAGLGVLSDVLTNPPTEEFDFGTDELKDIFAIVLVLGNETKKLAIYKKQSPINILRRRTRFSRVTRLVPTDSHLEELQKDVVEINSSFDFLQSGDDVLVLNLDTLEKYLGFQDVIQGIATETVRQIGELEFVANTDQITRFLSDMPMARKLMRLRRDSPVFNLEFDEVKTFISGHSKLSKMFKFNKDDGKIELNSKESVKRFIKLMDDDYLWSQLTKTDYDAERKEVLAEAAE